MRDFNIKTDGTPAKQSRFRLSDNYTRFYLKYLLPQKLKIKKGLYSSPSLDSLSQWPTIMGLQFQNLMNNNLPLILQALDIDFHSIIFAGPYFQTQTKVNKGVEIDLLIQLKDGNYYICEYKFKKRISSDVIDEMKYKIKNFKRPKYTSVRSVLIYEGELASAVSEAEFFSSIIHAGEFLKKL
jgi:hypothetical protein